MSEIDFNRGVTRRLTPNEVPIFEFRDQPGEYFDANSIPVDAKLAREAGFDVKAGSYEKIRRQMHAEASAEVEKEFQKKMAAVDKAAGEQAKVKVDELDKFLSAAEAQEDREISALEDATAPAPVFSIDQLGRTKDSYAVVDEDGKALAKDLTKSEAKDFLKQIREQMSPDKTDG